MRERAAASWLGRAGAATRNFRQTDREGGPTEQNTVAGLMTHDKDQVAGAALLLYTQHRHTRDIAAVRLAWCERQSYQEAHRDSHYAEVSEKKTRCI